MCTRLNGASLTLVKRLEAMMTGCDSNFDQQNEDIKQILLDSTGSSTMDTAIKLVNFFDEKYPTSRKFFSAMVYHEVSGFHDHALNFPLHQFRVGGKNAAVTWRFVFDVPKATIEEFKEKFQIPTHSHIPGLSYESERALEVYNEIAKNFQGRATFAVIKLNQDLWVHSPAAPFFVKKYDYLEVVFLP